MEGIAAILPHIWHSVCARTLAVIRGVLERQYFDDGLMLLSRAHEPSDVSFDEPLLLDCEWAPQCLPGVVLFFDLGC